SMIEYISLSIFNMNPQYILFIHMVINYMIQVTLSISQFIISDTVYKLNVSVCCLLVLMALITTENTPLNLACMSMECYIAICMPLRHVQICTINRTFMLIGLIWATTTLSVLPDLFITLATEPPDFFHSQIFCKREITYSLFMVFVWFTIFFSYFKILFTAKTASRDAKKARNTVLLHSFQVFLCITTYIAPMIVNVLQRSFPLNFNNFLFIVYTVVQVLPRSISPIIYGVQDNTFRKYLRRYLLCKVRVL
uniref:G-protein coupled receptors family 1 profile domain-containing protein n=1 Tax=Nothobranchius furzeri TaxID=105023 RepID=A0A8C6LGD3_NOTFU